MPGIAAAEGARHAVALPVPHWHPVAKTLTKNGERLERLERLASPILSVLHAASLPAAFALADASPQNKKGVSGGPESSNEEARGT
jgi:hypothetical protein